MKTPRSSVKRFVGPLLLAGSLAAALAWAVSDSRSSRLGWNTLVVAGGSSLLATPCGVLLAALLTRTNVAGRRIALMLIGGFLFVPLYAHVAAWDACLGSQGMLTRRVLPEDWPPLLVGVRGALLVHALSAVPWVTLIVGLGLLQVERDQEESALLAAGPATVLWRLSVVRGAPFAATSLLWVFVLACGEIAVADAFLVRTYAEELYQGFNQENELSDAPLRVLPGALALVGLVCAAWAVLGQWVPPAGGSGLRRASPLPLRRGRWAMSCVAWCLLLVIVGVPCLTLAYVAGYRVTHDESGWTRQWEWSHAVTMLAMALSENIGAWRGSLGIGLLAATMTTAASVPLAWWVNVSRRAMMSLGFLSALAIATPGPAVGLALIGCMNRSEAPWLTALYDRSLLAPCLAVSVRALPLAGLLVFFAFRTLDRESLEASTLEGAGAWRRLVRIALPQRMGACFVAWLVALAIAVGDLATTILVLPPGVRTLAQVSADEIHRGVHDRFAGLSLAIFAFAFALFGAMCLASRGLLADRGDKDLG